MEFGFKTLQKSFNFNIKQLLRKSLSSKYPHLSPEEQTQASLDLQKVLGNDLDFLKSHTVAAYWPKDQEIDPRPLILEALSQGKRCFLPVLDPLNRKPLLFVEYKAGDPLFPNRFNILEPDPKTRECIPAWALDLVLVPLLAFDKKGHRLGKGLGHYDASFNFLHLNFRPKSPRLIGLGFEFQEIDTIPQDSWDTI